MAILVRCANLEAQEFKSFCGDATPFALNGNNSALVAGRMTSE